jgi:IS1 family transposase
LLTPFSIGVVVSDDKSSYAGEVPKDIHLTGKIFTQRIKRNNLHATHTSGGWHIKRFTSRIPSKSTKKSSVISL